MKFPPRKRKWTVQLYKATCLACLKEHYIPKTILDEIKRLDAYYVCAPCTKRIYGSNVPEEWKGAIFTL